MPPDIKLEHPTTSKEHEDLNASHSAPPRTNAKICRACGASGVKNRCGGCRAVFFCDRACQRAIWTTHRPECQRLTAASNDESNVAPSNPTATTKVESGSNTAEENKSHAAPLAVEVPTEETLPSSSSSPKKKAVVLVTEPEVLAVLPPREEEPVVEEETIVSTSSPPKTPPSSSSKKKKNKKKKARSNSLHAPASAPMATHKPKSRSQSLSVRKHVVWGEVQAREFTRFPGGGSAVPYDGSWALGLGSPVADVQLGSVLDVEELRLHELEARAKDLTKSQRARVREGETRQFDYKSGARNPLFGRLSERERRRLFSASELRHLHELEEQVAHRKRSVSSEAPQSPALGPTPDPLEGEDFACVANEQLNEFAVIRDSRDDACGCSCGELLKKVSKMNVKKLHAFLSERNVKIVGGHSKPELLAQAKAIAMLEQNCSNSTDCECARNGVGCHANVCVGCAGDCHNPHSQYAYNKDQVLQYRKQMIAQWNETQLDQQQHDDHAVKHTLHKQPSIRVA